MINITFPEFCNIWLNYLHVRLKDTLKDTSWPAKGSFQSHVKQFT